MKRFITSIIILVLSVFTLNGCIATNANQGALLGGLTGGIAHSMIGGNTEQGLAIVAGTSILGYMFGNEMDKQRVVTQHSIPAPPVVVQPNPVIVTPSQDWDNYLLRQQLLDQERQMYNIQRRQMHRNRLRRERTNRMHWHGYGYWR